MYVFLICKMCLKFARLLSTSRFFVLLTAVIAPFSTNLYPSIILQLYSTIKENLCSSFTRVWMLFLFCIVFIQIEGRVEDCCCHNEHRTLNPLCRVERVKYRVYSIVLRGIEGKDGKQVWLLQKCTKWE